MKDIVITHTGQSAENDLSRFEGDTIRLLHGESGFEAVIEYIPRGTVAYLYTVHKDKSFEFTYLLAGSIELCDGEEIGLPARIICVADAYDAMTVTRPYRRGISMDEAMVELRRCVGTQFDPRVVDALEQYLAENT